jgi:hypothetical protein
MNQLERLKITISDFLNRLKENKDKLDIVPIEARSELFIIPDYQRWPNAWNPEQKKKFLESLLKGLYIPDLLVAAEGEEGPWHILDGVQRAHAILEFTKEQSDLSFPEIDCQDQYYQYSKKKFKDLTEEQKNFWIRRTITVIPLNNCDGESQLDLFERINTGGKALKEIDLLHARFTETSLMKTAKKMSESSVFLNLTGINKKRKGKALWFVLNYLHLVYSEKEESGSLADKTECFLRQTAQREEKIQSVLEDELNKKSKHFESVMNILKDIFRDTKKPLSKISVFLYLSSTIAKALNEKKITKTQLNPVGPRIREFILKLNDKKTIGSWREYLNSKEKSWNGPDILKDNLEPDGIVSNWLKGTTNASTRHDNLKAGMYATKQIIDKFVQELDSKRAYASNERSEILKNNSDKICAICGEPLLDSEEFPLEADHKIPHSVGGKTTVENGQMVHQYCNRKKGKNT